MNIEKIENIEPSGEFAASIRDFRSAVTHVADREMSRPVAAGWLSPASKRRRAMHQRMALGWACAALLCVATFPFSGHLRHTPTHIVATPVTAAPSPQTDTALIEQVDTDVAASVPSPLAPLAELDNWDTSSANTLSDASGNGAALTRTERTNVAK